MSFKQLSILVVALFPLFGQAKKQAFPAVEGIIERQVPWLAGHVELVKGAPSAAGRFTLETTRKGRLRITASDVSAAAVGLNWYLKYYCHRQMSHMGDNLAPVGELPRLSAPETHECSALLRYALNYCTHNYSFSFYTWADWERELDWMALHGVNMMLVVQGQEALWQNVMRRLGFTEQEIRDFIPGPAYTAWWLMGNLEGEGGPMPQTQIDSRVTLARQIMGRMRELGMEPLMPGFYGMVPTTLKNHLPQAHTIPQGMWGGLFVRPDMLAPTDPEFARIAAVYYEEMKKLYGTDIRYFAGDPFHEGGKMDGVDLADVGECVQREMRRHYPESTWVLQGWWANPRAELLSRLDKQHTLVQELCGETTSNWEKRNGYEQTPFVWCTITNFGERTGYCGKLERLAREWNHVRTTESMRPLLKGVGIMPEGIRNNPVVYELALELPWHEGEVDVAAWVKDYAAARYGARDADIEAAWAQLLRTVYRSTSSTYEGPIDNRLTTRPTLKGGGAVRWGTTEKSYKSSDFLRAERLFSRAAPRFAHSRTYQLDLTAMDVQLLSCVADTIYAAIQQAVATKDKVRLDDACARFLALGREADALLATDPFFRLDHYVDEARCAGNTPEEERNNVRNLLALVTYWGNADPASDALHEYAVKEWNGLLGSYYGPRWELYFANLRRQLRGESVQSVSFPEWERRWVDEQLERIFSCP